MVVCAFTTSIADMVETPRVALSEAVGGPEAFLTDCRDEATFKSSLTELT